MQETQETPARSLGGEDPLEEGTAAHCSTRAWRTPWTGEPGGLQSVGSRSRTGLSTHSTKAADTELLWRPEAPHQGGGEGSSLQLPVAADILGVHWLVDTALQSLPFATHGLFCVSILASYEDTGCWIRVHLIQRAFILTNYILTD